MIDYIELDKKRPITFGMNALRLFTKEVGVSLSGIGPLLSDIDIDSVIKLLYFGLKDGARIEGEPYELSLEQTADLVTNMSKLTEVFDIFLEQYSDGTEGKQKGVPS
jgi:hypothetical protein